jgi:hypothetical protein
MAQRKSGSTAQGCGCLAFIVLLVIGGISWAWGEVFGSHPAASSAPQQAVATQASDTPEPPADPWGKKPWPRLVPRRAIGQTLARASASDLRCFNRGAAYAPSGRNIMNASADAAHRWRIVRISPVPGTLVKAGTELTLRLKLATPRLRSPRLRRPQCRRLRLHRPAVIPSATRAPAMSLASTAVIPIRG